MVPSAFVSPTHAPTSSGLLLAGPAASCLSLPAPLGRARCDAPRELASMRALPLICCCCSCLLSIFLLALCLPSLLLICCCCYCPPLCGRTAPSLPRPFAAAAAATGAQAEPPSLLRLLILPQVQLVPLARLHSGAKRGEVQRVDTRRLHGSALMGPPERGPLPQLHHRNARRSNPHNPHPHFTPLHPHARPTPPPPIHACTLPCLA